MLKVISPSRSQSLFRRLTTAASNPCPQATGGRAPLLRFWDSLRNQNVGNPAYRQRYFCSESGGRDGSESEANDGAGNSAGENSGNAKGEAGESVEEVPVKTSSAIVPTNPRPEDYLKLYPMQIAL